jgi:hypothetical protein
MPPRLDYSYHGSCQVKPLSFIPCGPAGRQYLRPWVTDQYCCCVCRIQVVVVRLALLLTCIRSPDHNLTRTQLPASNTTLVARSGVGEHVLHRSHSGSRNSTRPYQTSASSASHFACKPAGDCPIGFPTGTHAHHFKGSRTELPTPKSVTTGRP